MHTPDIRAVPPLCADPCPVCGLPLPAPTGKAGRPAETCSEPCRVVWKLVRDIEVGIGVIQDRAAPQAWLDLRSRLWRATNDRPWNRGLKAVD